MTSRGLRIMGSRLAPRSAVFVVAAGLLLAGYGTAGLVLASSSSHLPHPAPRVRPVLPPVGRPQTPAPYQVDHVAPPVSLAIPSIGVRTRIIRLGLTRVGTLQVPGSAAVAGWYTGSPRPGAIGSSVIAGHVDSYTGPGVFFYLRDLRAGDRIYVSQASGKVAAFRVTQVGIYPKSRFPTYAVYGPAPTPQLRLITCGGTFDYQTGHYLSNVVVWADLVS